MSLLDLDDSAPATGAVCCRKGPVAESGLGFGWTRLAGAMTCEVNQVR
jgi:hypothetical protein